MTLNLSNVWDLGALVLSTWQRVFTIIAIMLLSSLTNNSSLKLKDKQ